MADCFQMAERVHHELDGGGLVDQQLGARVRQDDRDRVVQHRRAAGELALGLKQRAVGQLGAADLGRDDDRARARSDDRLDCRIDRLGVRAVGDEDADRAALDRLWFERAVDDAQRRRQIHVPHRSGALCRFGHGHDEAIGDTLGERRIDVDEIGQHAGADMREPDLGQLEHQSEGEVRLLGRGERAEEQPRLAVMVGEAVGTDAQLVALLVGGVASRLSCVSR